MFIQFLEALVTIKSRRLSMSLRCFLKIMKYGAPKARLTKAKTYNSKDSNEFIEKNKRRRI